MASFAKITANRANARKSTGPRTARGKNNSKLNAVKFGIYATTPVLAGEDADAYRKMENSNREYFDAVGPVEIMLVRQATIEEWRLQRIEKTESVIHARLKEAQLDELLTSLTDREMSYFSSAYGEKYGAQIIEELDKRRDNNAHPLTKLSRRLLAPNEIETEISEETEEDVKYNVETKLRRIQGLDGTLLEVTDPKTESPPQIYLLHERRSTVKAYLAYVEILTDLQEARRTVTLRPFPAEEREPAASTDGKPLEPSPDKPTHQYRQKSGNQSSAKDAMSARRRQKLQNILSHLRAKSDT